MPNPAFGRGEGDTRTDADNSSEASSATLTDTDPSDTGPTDTSPTDTSPTDTTDTGPTDTTDTSPTDTSPTDTSPTDTDPTDTDPTASSTTDSETGDNMCDLGFSEGLKFKVINSGNMGACPNTYEGDGVLQAVSAANGLTLIPCGEGCMSCDAGFIDLEFYPADLGPIATAVGGECIHFKYELLAVDGNDVCQYRRATISYFEDNQLETPLAVGSTGAEINGTFANDFLTSGGIGNWQLVDDEACDCANPDPCCMLDDPPSVFGIKPDGSDALYVGGTLDFQATGVGYQLELWQAQLIDSCGAELQLSWMARPAG